jgi:hypothetical protein
MTLASIFLSASQKLHGNWRILTGELMIYTTQGILHKPKIAGFDLGKRFIKFFT